MTGFTLPLRALAAGMNYFRHHPSAIIYAARQAVLLRVVVPIDALRWLAANAPTGKRAPRDLVLEARPPALHVAATVDLMGNPLRVGAAFRVDELHLDGKEIRVSLRLANVTMTALGAADGPLATLLKSGALDLTRPGNLASFLPKRPAALVEAKDDRIVIDLLKVPRVAELPFIRRLLGVVTPVLTLNDLSADEHHLVFAFRPSLAGIPRALAALRP